MLRLSIFAISVIAFFCGCGASSASPASLTGQDDAARCEQGRGTACSRLGMALWMDARAGDTEPSAALPPFERACDSGSWLGCAMAASLQSELGIESSAMATRAVETASSACDEGRAPACHYLGDWAERAGDEEKARDQFARACKLIWRKTGEPLEDHACERAIYFGVSREELAAEARASNLSLERLSGETRIHPSREEAIEMRKRRVVETGAEVALCLSDDGRPAEIFFSRLSEFPDWNRRIFESVRNWRYRVTREDPNEPPCTSVTFLYRRTQAAL